MTIPSEAWRNREETATVGDLDQRRAVAIEGFAERPLRSSSGPRTRLPGTPYAAASSRKSGLLSSTSR